jgi:Fic family protein
MRYIWQHSQWPDLRWNAARLLPLVSAARVEQGKLLGRVRSLGFALSREAEAEILVEEAVQTSAIEGEHLQRGSVRSSVARRLGLATVGLPAGTKQTDGLVEVLLDATRHYERPLTAARLKGWQAALFPTGYSGLTKIKVGQWRGPRAMQVVSGRVGREILHYEAPPGHAVPSEMQHFLWWWRASLGDVEGLIRSGLAHFYFVTIHPFEDGNGRLARALTDMALAQDEHLRSRFYSLSHQIRAERDDYYSVLEQTQKGGLDVTNWLEWFLGCSARSVDAAHGLVAKALTTAEFWHAHAAADLTDRQRKVLNRLLDTGGGGFEGGLTTRKYASLARTSRVTAYREIAQLVELRMIEPNQNRGRSTSYRLKLR